LLFDDNFGLSDAKVVKKSVNRVTGMFMYLLECPTIVAGEVAVLDDVAVILSTQIWM